jgi:nitrate reductase alpha subunit
VTDTRIPPREPGAALPAAGRFFRPGTPTPDPHGVTTWEIQETDYRDLLRGRQTSDDAKEA